VLKAVKLLLKLGADVNAADDNGETVMHGSAYWNHPKLVQLLADNGAKIAVWNKANKTRLTPLVIAEGHRPGLNFRPSPETVAALHRVMLAAGVTPPNSSERPPPQIRLRGRQEVAQVVRPLPKGCSKRVRLCFTPGCCSRLAEPH
jgi:ankyrin repeat protein